MRNFKSAGEFERYVREQMALFHTARHVIPFWGGVTLFFFGVDVAFVLEFFKELFVNEFGERSTADWFFIIMKSLIVIGSPYLFKEAISRLMKDAENYTISLSKPKDSSRYSDYALATITFAFSALCMIFLWQIGTAIVQLHIKELVGVFFTENQSLGLFKQAVKQVSVVQAEVWADRASWLGFSLPLSAAAAAYSWAKAESAMRRRKVAAYHGNQLKDVLEYNELRQRAAHLEDALKRGTPAQKKQFVETAENEFLQSWKQGITEVQQLMFQYEHGYMSDQEIKDKYGQVQFVEKIIALDGLETMKKKASLAVAAVDKLTLAKHVGGAS